MHTLLLSPEVTKVIISGHGGMLLTANVVAIAILGLIFFILKFFVFVLTKYL